MRGKEIYTINKNPSHHLFRRIREIANDLFFLVKKAVLVGLVFWGGQKYLTQNGTRTAKQGLKAQLSVITDSEIGKNFKDGLGVIRDFRQEQKYNNSAQGKAHRKAYYEEQRKRREELKEMGVDPTIRYLKPGDPGYKEELEFQRNLMKGLDR